MELERLEAVLRYCRLEEFAQDAAVAQTVEALHAAAVEYLADAGVVRSARNGARFDLAAQAMVLHWYDQRGDVITGTIVAEIPLGLRQMINQLKLTGLAGDGGT